MKLIISEKDNAAKRIAQILSGGKSRTEKAGSLPIYKFSENGEEVRCMGLKGHILRVDFPDKYNNWQKVEPITLIDAKIVKTPIQKNLIQVLKSQAKEADEAIVATDFDREGELIGLDAVNVIKQVQPKMTIRRARFSSLTEGDIKKAFSDLDEVYEDLAHAGEARQDIDLIWGATLTRFISLASARLGKHFLSVGRVQSPTLALIAMREKERQAFVPEPYWQVKVVFGYDGQQLVVYHKKDRFKSEQEAKDVVASLSGEGVVSEVSKSTRETRPPAPFNTTAYLSAAASQGIPASQAMRLAENLYLEGLVSYPRVDNTVYPDSLDMRDLLAKLKPSPELGSLAEEILGQDKLVPTRGKKQATDHPPIHPTGVADKSSLRPRQWKAYELIYRRFLATLASAAKSESSRIDISVGEETFALKGSRVVVEGWLRYYPYSRRQDEELPPLKEGDRLEVIESIIEAKETQPPGRYGQGHLIRKMEELGLGTKSTRHSIIQNLYDRGYTHSDPVVPTEMGLAVAEALLKHAERIATPQMTAELEKEMDAIAEGATSPEKVVDRSREMLGAIMVALKAKEQEVGEGIRDGIREGKIMGTCPKCGESLRIIRAKKSKKRFVGCSGYPKCSNAYPLPQFGEIVPLGQVCEDCGSPRIKVLSGKSWEMCIDPSCPTKKNNNRKNGKDAEDGDTKGTASAPKKRARKSTKRSKSASGSA